MDTELIISIVLLITLAEIFAVILFVKHRRGDVQGNPFITLIKKEWLMIYYAFFRWKRKELDSPDVQTFYYHKGSLYFWLFLALLHEQVIEGIVFHIYLKEVDPLRANILLILHVYSILYILGDYNLVRNSPIEIIKNKVRMKIGARRELTFHVKDVEGIQPAKVQYHKSGGMVHEKNVFHAGALPRVLTRIFGVTDELKYEILFKKPLYARGYIGQKKEVTKALIYMDQADALIETIKTRMDSYNDTDDEAAYVEVQKRKPSLINWKVYFILLILNVLGASAIAPYAMARENYHEIMGLSELAFTMYYVVQVFLEAGILLFIALWLARRTGVKIPIIESIVAKNESVKNLHKKIAVSAFYGILAGAAIIIFSLMVSERLGVDNSSLNEPSWWLGVIGSFGAAVNEESIFRLFLITFLIWMFMKLKKGRSTFTNWTAIILASLVFGLMHYSVASSAYEMTLGIFVSMLVINGLGGIVFGALFVYIGLEFAIIAHFTADITLHVIGPFIAEVFSLGE
ncbi:CPBP family intramembrane glutamic endopeptidase [Bacillus sp. P14.5]|uniref:CPBP family intramembrane glutamic endopeptidase n=1 Tax=Bacillus sp. P14.5 TaxID=1983400 RepID=UPI000DE93587|nr:CPBP family intramembrane glutamic endopeptidase [Bacillus sp. P14.5]